MSFISSAPEQASTREPKSNELQANVINRLDRYFRESVDHPNRVEWLEEAEKASHYRDGNQLTPSTKARLKKRGQPEVTENRCKVQIDKLLGKWKKQRTVTKFLGRNTPIDEPDANLFSDISRWVKQTAQFEFSEMRAVKDDFTHGFGVLEWGIHSGEFGFQQIFGREENPFAIFPDPFSKRYDWNLDARYICRAKWMDLEDAIERWPDKEMQLRQCVFLNTGERLSIMGRMDPSFVSVPEGYYVDSKRERIRPVEVWYKRKAKRKVVVSESGIKVEVDTITPGLQKKVESAGLTLTEDIIDEMWVGIFCSHILIHHDVSPFSHKLYPFVPYWGYRKDSGVPYGWLLNLLGLQDEHNKRRQKALHLFISQQVLYNKNAIKNPGRFAEELAQPSGMMEVEGKLDQVEILKNLDMGQAQLVLHQETRQAFDDVAAHSPVDVGQAPGEVRSDRGLQRLQAGSADVLTELFTNIRQSQRMNERLIFELSKDIISEDMVIHVLDEPDKVKEVPIQKNRFLTAKQRIYDLVVVDTQDHETSRSEQLAMMFNVVPNILKFGPGWVNFMLELTDLREKDNLREILKATQTTPPVEPRVSMQLNWAEMSPIERAGWALALGQGEIAQAVLEQGDVSKQTMAAQVEQMKQASKERMETLRIRQKDLESQGKTLAENEQRELQTLQILGNLSVQNRKVDVDREKAQNQGGDNAKAEQGSTTS